MLLFNTKTIVLGFFAACLLPAFTLPAQTFVHPANQWRISDCCYSFIGQTNCNTYQYWFGDSVLIDGHWYLTLQTNNASPLFPIGQYYREANGKVFAKRNETENEFLIYDFDAVVGEQIELGSPPENGLVQVVAIDSVTLISGQQRKRLEITSVSFPDNRTYWIEGVGSLLSPMNTTYMFSLDCWVDLGCFYQDGSLEWGSSACSVSTGAPDRREARIRCYPNPAQEALFLDMGGKGPVAALEISGIGGCVLRQIEVGMAPTIPLEGIPGGYYWVKVVFQDGAIGWASFVKMAER